MNTRKNQYALHINQDESAVHVAVEQLVTILK